MSELERFVEEATPDTWIGVASAIALVLLLLRIYRRRGQARVAEASGWSLSQVIYSWSQTEALTLGNAYEGIFTCGATGSGKTSGSGRVLADNVLTHGLGGLVCPSSPAKRHCGRNMP